MLTHISYPQKIVCMVNLSIREGKIVKSKDGVVIFQEKGLLIEYTKEPFAMGESVVNYAEQWEAKQKLRYLRDDNVL